MQMSCTAFEILKRILHTVVLSLPHDFLACKNAGDLGGSVGLISGTSCVGYKGMKMGCPRELLMLLFYSHFYFPYFMNELL